MKIRYDPEADAMYIKLRSGKITKTKEIDENIYIDLDKNKQVIGIEILSVKEKNPDLLKQFQFENLVSG